jgi:hypothetical protein
MVVIRLPVNVLIAFPIWTEMARAALAVGPKKTLTSTVMTWFNPTPASDPKKDHPEKEIISWYSPLS